MHLNNKCVNISQSFCVYLVGALNIAKLDKAVFDHFSFKLLRCKHEALLHSFFFQDQCHHYKEGEPWEDSPSPLVPLPLFIPVTFSHRGERGGPFLRGTGRLSMGRTWLFVLTHSPHIIFAIIGFGVSPSVFSHYSINLKTNKSEKYVIYLPFLKTVCTSWNALGNYSFTHIGRCGTFSIFYWLTLL